MNPTDLGSDHIVARAGHRTDGRARRPAGRITANEPKGVYVEARDPMADFGRAPDFVHHVTIDVAADDLHAVLCDLEHYRPLHPLIESIEEIEPAEHLPGARRWRVVDRIPFGPLRLRTTYVAALESHSPREVRGHAWQSPGVRLVTLYLLEEGGSPHITRLEERVFVKAPFGLRRFVVKQASEAHAVTLERMKQLLEQGRGAPS